MGNVQSHKFHCTTSTGPKQSPLSLWTAVTSRANRLLWEFEVDVTFQMKQAHNQALPCLQRVEALRPSTPAQVQDSYLFS